MDKFEKDLQDIKERNKQQKRELLEGDHSENKLSKREEK